MEEAQPLRYDSKTPFKTLLAEAGDWDLVNSTFVKIGDRYGHCVDATQYTREERVIMLVWHSSGIIDNGGFEYLFSGDFDGDPDFSITAESFKTAGLTRGYEAFQRAFQLFPNGKVPHESEERIRQYKQTDDSVREEINTLHWQDGWDKLRERKLAEFIRENVSKLGDLDSPHPKPSLWRRVWTSAKSSEWFWGFVFGCALAAPVGLLSLQSRFWPNRAGAAFVLGGVCGASWARRRNQAADESIQRILDLAAQIGDVGQELLTVWIPLDHDLKDEDVTFAKQLWESSAIYVSQRVAKHHSTNTSLNAVGVSFYGHNADDMLEAIRPYFQRQCPRGSYVTRSFNGDGEAPVTTNSWPQPLFEDDQLPKWTRG